MSRWALLAFFATRIAFADEAGDLFARGNDALVQGKPNDAIAAFEALADRGITDASLSFNRGLSYATRVRINAGQPGDVGRAIHGFEEARSLSRDRELVRAAESALLLLRGEVARKQVSRGASMEVDRPAPLGRTLSSALAERTWNFICILSSIFFAVAIVARHRLGERGRLGAVIAGSLLVPCWGYTCTMSELAARNRTSRKEAVVIVENLRLAAEQGEPLTSGEGLPEGARVEVTSTRDGWSFVEWGRSKGSVPIGALRLVAAEGL